MYTRNISLRKRLAFVFSALIVSVILLNIDVGQILKTSYRESKLPQIHKETSLLHDNDCRFVKSVQDSDLILLNTGENLTFAMYKQRKAEAFLKEKGQPYPKNKNFPFKVGCIHYSECLTGKKRTEMSYN